MGISLIGARLAQPENKNKTRNKPLTVFILAKLPFDRRCFATRLTGDVLELFLDLLPVHRMPPIGNIFRSLVVVLEIIGMFPYIEA